MTSKLQRTELTVPNASMLNLTNINIILGRNGAGKSRFLRSFDAALSSDQTFNVRYISPERAGVFRKEGNVETNMERDKNWLRNVRGKNQAENFKAVSAYLLRNVEITYLRRLQDTPSLRNDPERNFRADRLDKINRLLSNISIEQVRAEFVLRNISGTEIQPDQISSGESEAIALASEIMYFFETVDQSKFNILLLDEPDVHLHPDLQARLAQFVVGEVEGLSPEARQTVALCIATHSTPLVCALAGSEHTSIGTKHFDVNVVHQAVANEQLRKAAPFFGHPLSLSLSQDVPLILEGEDDERVWQQAARSAQGKIRLFPILATSVDQQSELESFCAPLLSTLYDSPIAYSLRDGDGVSADLNPVGPVRRFRLRCYAIENALVTDDCLRVLGKSWEEFRAVAAEWADSHSDHRDVALVRKLVSAPDRLRNSKIKAIRQLICSIAGSNKPWEVVVGQAIGTIDPSVEDLAPTSLVEFVGREAMSALLGPLYASVTPQAPNTALHSDTPKAARR